MVRASWKLDTSWKLASWISWATSWKAGPPASWNQRRTSWKFPARQTSWKAGIIQKLLIPALPPQAGENRYPQAQRHAIRQ